MPIAWLDQYLLGAREIPLGHCSPCCRIDLLGCCNLKIHLFCALCLSLGSGLLSNGGSFGRPLVSTAPSAVVLPGHLATLGCDASSKDAPGGGRGDGAGRRERGQGRREGARGEKGNRYHLTFNLSWGKKSLRKLY